MLAFGFTLGNFKLAFHQIPLETGKEESDITIAAIIVSVIIIAITTIIYTIKHVATPPIRLALVGREI